jgi:hypothetical protein
MNKPFDTSGPAIKSAKPVAMRRYQPDRVPDPGDMVDCAIIINDKGDGRRGRVAVSDGSSWHRLAWADELVEVVQPVPVATPVTDLAAHMRQAINEAMPMLVYRAQQPVIDAGPQHDPAEVARIKAHVRELTAAVADAYEALETLSADVAEIEQTALADVSIVKG